MNFPTDNKAETSKCGKAEWLTGTDGTRHFLRCWRADNSSAYVVYLHGIEGHSLWFQDTAFFLQQSGVTTLALDRRGSGMSKEARGDMKNWQQLFSDTVEALRFARKQAGNLPVFLMANCWGAKLAALLGESQRDESKLISGLIFSSPAIDVKIDLPFKEKLRVAWRFALRNKQLLRIPLVAEDFTDNPQYLSFIENDPLRLTEATAHFFVNTFLLTILSRQSPARIYLPTLIVQSGSDSIVEVEGIRKWFERISGSDKTFHLFAHSHHSLDFDSMPGDYRKALLSWILQRSPHAPEEIAASTYSTERVKS